MRYLLGIGMGLVLLWACGGPVGPEVLQQQSDARLSSRIDPKKGPGVPKTEREYYAYNARDNENEFVSRRGTGKFNCQFPTNTEYSQYFQTTGPMSWECMRVFNNQSTRRYHETGFSRVNPVTFADAWMNYAFTRRDEYRTSDKIMEKAGENPLSGTYYLKIKKDEGILGSSPYSILWGFTHEGGGYYFRFKPQGHKEEGQVVMVEVYRYSRIQNKAELEREFPLLLQGEGKGQVVREGHAVNLSDPEGELVVYFSVPGYENDGKNNYPINIFYLKIGSEEAVLVRRPDRM